MSVRVATMFSAERVRSRFGHRARFRDHRPTSRAVRLAPAPGLSAERPITAGHKRSPVRTPPSCPPIPGNSWPPCRARLSTILFSSAPRSVMRPQKGDKSGRPPMAAKRGTWS